MRGTKDAATAGIRASLSLPFRDDADQLTGALTLTRAIQTPSAKAQIPVTRLAEVVRPLTGP
jgi:hypothetical protein